MFIPMFPTLKGKRPPANPLGSQSAGLNLVTSSQDKAVIGTARDDVKPLDVSDLGEMTMV